MNLAAILERFYAEVIALKSLLEDIYKEVDICIENGLSTIDYEIDEFKCAIKKLEELKKNK